MDFDGVTVPRRRRRVHRKVKTGCHACKVRRQKCGEQKPICDGCIRHSSDCSYPPPPDIDNRQQQGAKLQRQDRAVVRQTSLAGPRPTPSLPPTENFNLDDLELLHHFITSACKTTGQLPEATRHLQTTIPQLAQRHPFLMRGMLAKAAILLSWERPSQKNHYVLLAAKHHDSAFPDFRSALQNINEQNYLALIMYSKWLVWCSFSRYETFSAANEAGTYTADAHWLPNWFYLLRGSCLLVESCKAWIKKEWHIRPPPLEELTYFKDNSDSREILLLKSRLISHVQSPIYEVVLDGLYEAFTRASMRHLNNPLRHAMDYWVSMLPNDYLEDLHRGVPWALIVFAHFCILVFRSETRWFMEGQAEELLNSIKHRLSDSWEEYLKWPFEVIMSSRSSPD